MIGLQIVALLFFQILPGILLGVNFAKAAMADHLVINEIYIDSIVGSGGTEDDWVEIFNPTANVITLDGMSIQKTAGTGSSLNKQALSGNILPGAYILIVRDGVNTSQNLKDQADILVSNAFSLASGNVVYLVANDENITSASDTDIVDMVGFGDAAIFEGIAAAPEILETQSLSRNPDGEDTDNNSVDFIALNTPTPENSQTPETNSLNGSVVLTINKSTVPAINITPTSADISFQLNGQGSAKVNYGLATSYTDISETISLNANTDGVITLSNLQCGETYHYNIDAENTAQTESDSTADDVFQTMPCGINLDALTMTKTTAKANNQYADGWEWEFDLTVWNLNETSLKMKFNAWQGPDSIDSGGNMQFSLDEITWFDIDLNDSYGALGADITGIDLSPLEGRQIKVKVRMKIPANTLVGDYTTSYGILTE